MLIKFKAQNFLSFKEETEFNMLTGDVRRLPDHVLHYPKVDVLKSAVIYGANGAGKSNLIEAIITLCEIVGDGVLTFHTQPLCFRMNEEEDLPSKMSVEFFAGNSAFGYGVAFKDNCITEEWLTQLNFGTKEDDVIFKRTSNNDKHIVQVWPKYSKNQKDRLLIQVYQDDLLESDVPFISMVKDKKFAEINSAYKWLTKGTQIIFPNMRFGGLVSFLSDPGFKEFTNRIISSLSTGIHGIEIQTLGFDQYFGEDNLAEKERILKLVRNGEEIRVGDKNYAIAILEDGKAVIKKPISYHLNEHGKQVKFEMVEESSGTLRLIDFIPVLYMLEKHPVTVIIDEIDQSLHPSMLKEFISYIQKSKTKKGQLIFTTHESSLLDFELFRADEIWFAEKDKTGASGYYPLSEFNVRPDLDIRKGYLSGRFGAIPFLGNIGDLNWDNGED